MVPMRDVRVAAVCMASIPGDVEGNLNRTERFVSEAAGRGAEIVCFPELSIHGYTLRSQEHRLGDQQEIVRRIEDLARSQRILILAGLLIADEYRRPCICQVAAGPEPAAGAHRHRLRAGPAAAGGREGGFSAWGRTQDLFSQGDRLRH
ncbi:MAG: hypothetical protein CVU57_11630 [Deltaproteobacteria bacterium HGW-Deltaproteobacteria-15]|nr:MAG: hypothetical protein CVU57_11630 [Deltaproteobacteria bacterium HGW-Deltaproteobacteria-15]